MTAFPPKSPAGYVPEMAVAFANANGDADLVAVGNPLPVALQAFAASPPVTGSTATSTVIGPFVALPGRPVIITLTGTWSGQVRLTRSTDGGATRQPLTANGAAYGVFSANICEPVWEESEAAAKLYLDITVATGTLGYRMGQ
ncbi:hypothetical protein [Novosphingobium lentum]|uniref:hypothetical protein n=1 Tax=Novosphingobium lentum TaxID=145287 RepID=UPI000A65ED53|nr:hypothetical protein [Novosphingobium lentum]